MNLLTTQEVAKRLSVSDMTVIRLHDAGLLAAVEITKDKHRRTLRFRPETIDAFIQRQEKTSAEGR